MLNENQLKLLRHLARFNLLDYPSCLDMLNNDGGSDRTALSYTWAIKNTERYETTKMPAGIISFRISVNAVYPI